jgi:hypothetical protein
MIITEPNPKELSQSQSPTVTETYFQSRLQELGITDELNAVIVEYDCFDDHIPRQTAFFSEGKQGGIDILYVGLQGLKTYQKGRKELPYVRTRLHPDQCQKGLPKYLTPKGAGTQIFFPPQVLTAYHEKRYIKTLIVTEGEFKAFKACMHGLYCVGTQGIHNTHELDQKGNKILNTELAELIRACQVKNIILLFDNDCLTVAYEADKDMFKRPNSFYSAVRNFREYSKPFECDVYFAHLKTDLVSKGIDDLLCDQKDRELAIINDLLSLKQNSDYFTTLNVTDKSLTKIKAHFAITSVDDFYVEYEGIIGEKLFRYCGFYYQSDGKGPKLLVSDEINNFIRVGDEYYERIQKPDRTGKLVHSLEKRNKTTITDDYTRAAIRYIRKYKAFCLVPSHTNFRQEIEFCYNAYHQLTHRQQPGICEQSLAIVKHIFQGQYEFGLDYIQLLFTRPDQLLPILLIQSEKRGTGKSTFGQWLIEIFQANAAKLSNQDLESDFNSTYAERLLIVVDETALSKKVTSEAIKKMSTEQGKIWVNAKGRQQYETDWIGKFVFITNNENTSLYIGKGETRYFVRTVSPFEGAEEPDMLEKLREELPAFLHFLQNRPLHYQRAGRMYFDFSVYCTPELSKAIEANISNVERELRQLIEDTFDMFPELTELQFAPTDLYYELKDKCGKWLDETIIKNCLKQEFKLAPGKQERYKYYSVKLRREDTGTGMCELNRNGKPYTFYRKSS